MNKEFYLNYEKGISTTFGNLINLFKKKNYQELLNPIIINTCVICSIFKENFNNVNEDLFKKENEKDKIEKVECLILYQEICKSSKVETKLFETDYCSCKVCDNINCFDFYLRRVLINHVDSLKKNFKCICNVDITGKQLLSGFYGKYFSEFKNSKKCNETETNIFHSLEVMIKFDYGLKE